MYCSIEKVSVFSEPKKLIKNETQFIYTIQNQYFNKFIPNKLITIYPQLCGYTDVVLNFEKTSRMNEYQLKSKADFRTKIEKYYFELAEYQIPIDLLNRLVDKITDTQFDNYKRFWDQYPKSRKRYSELKLSDLDHPFTQYEITNYFKDRDLDNYKKFSMILLKMTDKEFSIFEKSKYQYETK
jgi:hypothetical protein